MSFGDIYSAPPGSSVGSNAPGLPSVNLPEGQQPPPRQPLRITVRPQPGSWLETAPEWKPPEEPKKGKSSEPSWLETAPEWKPKELPPEISRTEAAERGLGAGISFGGAPALEGLAAASLQPAPETPTERASGSAAYRPIQGLINLLRERDQGVTGLIAGPGPATKAYRQARDEAQAKLEASREQHPLATFGGEIAGSILAPAPGTAKLAQGASLPTRLLRGAITGGTAGALYGTGTAISKGEDLEQAIEEILGSAGTGSLFGSAFHGAVGPRARPTNSPGQAAAATAQGLGAPIPRGLASDNPSIQAATSKLRQFPVVGPRISKAVENFQEATGERIGEIAQGSRGVAPSRALAGATLRPALREYQEANKATIGRAYDLLNRVSDTTKFAQRIAAGKAIETVLKRRRGARLANPEAGLEDVLNILYGGKGGTHGGGIAFKGLQEARSLLGEKLKFPEQHPGFRTGEGRLIYAAMSRDMEDAIRKYAKINPDEAVRYLNSAHRVAQEMIERNTAAQRVLNISNDESLVGALVNTAQERTGNLELLRNLRSTMPAADFQHISGTLLAELGHNPATDEFSLAKFVTGWGNLSDAAKQELFSPQHLQELNNIFGAGKHIKGALKESNTSHTAGVLILLDVAKDAALLAADLASGGLGMGSAVGAGTTAIMSTMAYWLGSPAKTASISKWVSAYRALTQGTGLQTPARLAAFNIATRNLANTLGVPVEQILKRVAQENGVGAAIPQRQALPAR